MVGFYFLLINVIRLIPMGPLMRFFIEGILPCITALIGAMVLILLTERELRAE